MRIREYQLAELDEARRIQQECVRLHMLSPPVLHWNYEIKKPNGETVEIGRGKANSYTRNGLNILAFQVGLCSTGLRSTSAFGDGIISVKRTGGGINGQSDLVRYYTSDAEVLVGESTAAESLDSYESPTTSLAAGTNAVSSTFNATTRKLITLLTRTFVNNTSGAIDITEAAIQVKYSSSSYYSIYVRDAFDAISVPASNTLTWTYTTEVAYPNP